MYLGAAETLVSFDGVIKKNMIVIMKVDYLKWWNESGRETASKYETSSENKYERVFKVSQ